MKYIFAFLILAPQLGFACSCLENYMSSEARAELEASRYYFLGSPISGDLISLDQEETKEEYVTSFKVTNKLTSEYSNGQVLEIYQKSNFCTKSFQEDTIYKVLVSISKGKLTGSYCSIRKEN